MKEYGWDYQTYQSQPAWVLELAQKKLSIESKKAKQAADAVQ